MREIDRMRVEMKRLNELLLELHSSLLTFRQDVQERFEKLSSSADEPPKKLLTIEQVCKRQGISDATLRKLRLRGDLRPIVIGGSIKRYRVFDVERLENKIKVAK